MQNSLESKDRRKALGQRKTCLRMRRRNLFFQLPGNRLCTEDFIGEFVDKCAECFGNGKCFFVVNREVDGTSVNSIVSVEAAQIGESQELRRKIQAAEFLGKSFSLCVSCVHHFFKTGAKEGASGAWRKVNDGLCLAKDRNSAFRHVLGRDDPAFNRINGLSVDFKDIGKFPSLESTAKLTHALRRHTDEILVGLIEARTAPDINNKETEA